MGGGPCARLGNWDSKLISHVSVGGSNTLTILEPAPANTLNPLLTHTAAGVDATAPVFDSLVRIDSSGHFQPDLALRWHRSVDTRTWTFTLDPRARWQDGERVTPDDVAFTIGLVRDARFGAASTVGFSAISSVTISDTQSLTITLHGSYAPFLATVGTTPILPAHVLRGIAPDKLRNYAPFNRHPIGTGPFIVAAMTGDGRVIEQANPDYFGGAPHLDRLIFTPDPSQRDAVARVQDDGATLAPPSLGLTAASVTSLARARSVRTVYTPSFAWTHLDLIEHGLFSNPLVRRALAYATPRDQLVSRVLRGHGHISDGDQAPGTAAYDPSLHGSYHYNIREARVLLRKAGLNVPKHGPVTDKGKPFVIQLWGDASCATCVQSLDLIAHSWQTAGLQTRVHLVPTSTLFGPRGPLYNPDRFTAPTYDAVLYTWVNGPDPDDSAYWSSGALVTAAHPLGGNFTGYSNPKLDNLLTLGIIYQNGPERYAVYRQIQRILRDDEPAIFLYWADMVSLAPATLRGYAPTPYNPAVTWNARDWSLT